MKHCTIESCPNRYLSSGYCSTHYKQYVYLPRRPLYHIWQSMMARCYKKWSSAYSYYGGRGIQVCERWHTFSNFEADMSPRPDELSLDRKDNDGDYTPENCRWATPLEQRHNQRKQKMRRDNTSGKTNWRQLPSGNWEERGTNGKHIRTVSKQWYKEALEAGTVLQHMKEDDNVAI